MNVTPQDHAVFSASGAHRWMRCIGSLAMEQGMPDSSSKFAEEGTAAHEILAMSLKAGVNADHFLGWEVYIQKGKVANVAPVQDQEVAIPSGVVTVYTVDQNMVDHVQTCIDIVMDLMKIEGAVMFVETRVFFGHVIGIEGQFGTSDITIVIPGEIIVVDFKYGMGVEVSAYENEQLSLYGLGALRSYEFIYDIKTVRMIIVQPRIEHLSEWSCSVEDLHAFGRRARECAQKAKKLLDKENITLEELLPFLNPGIKQCKFCKAKHKCPALANFATNAIADDFVDLSDTEQALSKLDNGINLLDNMKDAQRLSTLMKAAPLVELWIKAVREQVYKEMMGGVEIPGFKLVRGKKGNRKWSDEARAEELLLPILKHNAFKPQELITPAEAKKRVIKNVPARWPAIEAELVTQTMGKLSVAEASDPRPSETPQADIEASFENLETEGD